MELDKKLFLIGLNIGYYRRMKHLTQIELSERVGIPSSCISRIERGSKNISLDKLLLVADALGVDDKALLDYSREREE